MNIRITCINKDNGDHYDPNEAITHFGWINEGNNNRGKATLSEMVKYLEDGNDAYVKSQNTTAYLVVRTSRFNNKYVKTVANGRETDNLLHLLECN